MNNLHIILLIVILALLAFVYSREKFLNFVFCNTVKNREDCISYGCEMKDIKTTDIKCIDDNETKLNNCNIRRETNLNKLNKILEPIEISNEDIYYDNKYFVPEYQNYYLRLVRPGNQFKNYLKEEDSEKNYSFTRDSVYMFKDDNITIEDWNTYSYFNYADLVFENPFTQENIVKILIVYNIDDNNIKLSIQNLNVSDLKFKNDKYLNQINSFDNCFKLNGNEVNYGNSLVKCDNPIDYSKCERIDSKGMGDGCFNNKSKEACLYNTDNSTENKCKWVSSNSLPNDSDKDKNYYGGYCVSKEYKINEANLEEECLFVSKDDCKASMDCVFDETTNKCLNKKHITCDNISNKQDCDDDLDCIWDNNLDLCKVKKNKKNLIKYNEVDEISYSIIDSSDIDFLDNYLPLAVAYEKEIVNKQFLKF